MQNVLKKYDIVEMGNFKKVDSNLSHFGSTVLCRKHTLPLQKTCPLDV